MATSVGSDDIQAAPGQAPVRELIDRIHAHRQTAQAPAPTVQSFCWESGAEGLILWVEGAPRSPLVGQSIASASERYGVDTEAAGAFRRRMPFRDACLTVAGTGSASGEWRISGVPFFDPSEGHFLGYRGSARRPRANEAADGGEMAQEEQPGLFGSALAPDALRQLVHELRTPLNAIMGFAEMIDGQYLGPAQDGYRARAARIREQAQLLLSSVDDVDTAARIDTGRLPASEQSAADAVALLYRLHEGLNGVSGHGQPALRMEFAPDLPLARVEPEAAERMLSRLLSTSVAFAEQGEVLEASIAPARLAGAEMLCIAIARPRSLRGLEEARLLDPGFSPPGYWPSAPALGIGFALRLVRNLAEGAGGSLAIEPDRFLLALPPLDAAAGG
ncbi:MAG TPA: histidine kinase dimerization/phospho-acceptor domain-containing protein [Allosphingosinicella sp.]